MVQKHLTNDIANNLCKPCSVTGALDTSDKTAFIHKHNAPNFDAIAYFSDILDEVFTGLCVYRFIIR